MTQFELWVKGCEINKTLVYPLHLMNRGEEVHIPETGIYKLTNEYMSKGYRYYETPVYMVWWRGKQLVATTDINNAWSVWNRAKAEDEWKPFRDLPKGATLKDWMDKREELIHEGRLKANE